MAAGPFLPHNLPGYMINRSRKGKARKYNFDNEPTHNYVHQLLVSLASRGVMEKTEKLAKVFGSFTSAVPILGDTWCW